MSAIDPTKPECLALIHIGATSITLLIGELNEEGRFATLDHLERPLPLARDIFRSGMITRPVIEQAAAILHDFQLSLNEYTIPDSAVRCFTTNILAEATNHEIFLNRMQIASGFVVRIIDDGDMTHLIYQTTLRLLKANPEIANANTLISHIGPGNTRALYFHKGRIATYSSYRLGIFRTTEAVADTGSVQQLAYIEEQIRGVVDHLATDYSQTDIDYHVAIGAEIQSVAPHISPPVQGASFISLKQLEKFTEKLALMSADEMVRRLHLNYTGSEGLVAALQTNLALARRFNDKVIVVPEGDFHSDLIHNLLDSRTEAKTFQDEILQAAREVGKKFHTDRKHAEHVARFSQELFIQLQDLHGLTKKHELLLRVAAILHEIGMFVSAREHHKHSLYLILHTEIFGLSSSDRTIIALLARYHRRYNPDSNHPHYADLTRDERLIVFKLAAILRVADCLDRSHSQRIKNVKFVRERDTLYIDTTDVEDTTVEQLAINSKCDLFHEVYGYEPILRNA